MEITPSALKGDYERYELLILKKEQLEKEADLINLDYVRTFGELATAAFELKVDCIYLKKQISFFVAARNRRERIIEQQVLALLESQMTAYRDELDRLIQERNAAESVRIISEVDVMQIKAIYRRLAKLLHPDISPLTKDYPQLQELFNRVIAAYKCNDLKLLRQLEVLINRELEENGIDSFDMVIPDIEDRIAELEEDIDSIVNSIPYTYKSILEDSEAVEEKKQEFEEEIRSYTEYKASLSEELERIRKELENGGLIE